MNKTKCKHIKANKKRCNSYSMNDSEYCYFHNPMIKESTKQKARKNGGSQASLKINCENDFDYYELDSIESIMKLNAVLINKALHNQLELKVITGIAYNLQLQMKLIDSHFIENKLLEIENNISENNHISDNEL